MQYLGAHLHNFPLWLHSPLFSTLTAERYRCFKLFNRTGLEEGEMCPSVFSLSPDNFLLSEQLLYSLPGPCAWNL